MCRIVVPAPSCEFGAGKAVNRESVPMGRRTCSRVEFAGRQRSESEPFPLNGSSYPTRSRRPVPFSPASSDSGWTNYPGRFCRLRWPSGTEFRIYTCRRQGEDDATAWARGGIGRREGLRILWRNPCRFDPCRAHQHQFVQVEAQRAAAFVHLLSHGGNPESPAGCAGLLRRTQTKAEGREQPANDLQQLPGAGHAAGCKGVVWNCAAGGQGQGRGGEGCGVGRCRLAVKKGKLGLY